MTESDGAAAFAAFREAVFSNFHLLRELRPPLCRDAYIAQVVTLGAERGFRFEPDDVRAALRDGELAWLLQGVEVVA